MLGRQMLSFTVHGTEIVERGVPPLVVVSAIEIRGQLGHGLGSRLPLGIPYELVVIVPQVVGHQLVSTSAACRLPGRSRRACGRKLGDPSRLRQSGIARRMGRKLQPL